jgi:Fe-S cluster assembly scaffold protein SufB
MADEPALTRVPHRVLAEAQHAGIDLEEGHRSGTLFHVDQATLYATVNKLYEGQLEVLDTKEALRRYSWLKEYRWRLIAQGTDAYTKKVAEHFSGGYFLRILPHADVVLPLQMCLMITQRGLEQRVHNIIIAEEGSKARVITSCLQHAAADQASHLGVSEVYVKKDAALNVTMIHQWSENTVVRPRSAALIDAQGAFVSNYICLRPVKDMQMYPVAYCHGDGAKASFNSVLYGHAGASLDVGSRAVLKGRGSKAEMVTRAIAREGSKIVVRGMIEGNTAACKGHLECRGLILDDDAFIQSIPELIARTRGAEITHEAAVGKLSEKEIVYLMTRRLTRDQAVSTIIRGFMDVDIMGLPPALTEEVNHIVDLAVDAN